MKRTKQLVVLMMSVMLTASSCSKEEEPVEPVVTTPTGTGTGTGTSTYFFSGNINVTSTIYNSGQNSIYNGAVSESSGNGSGGVIFSSGTVFSDINDGDPTLEIFIMKNFATSPLYNNIYDMFGVTTYSYGDEDTYINGAKVRWYDGNKSWSSDDGAGTQTGSTFSITNRGPYNGDFSLFTFKGSFSCNLYDGSGGVITIQNATFSGQVSPYQ
jgi:hypothetical protein